MVSGELAVLLAAIALLAGVGITAIGPGGIFLTIALYALLPIAPPTIAGTASATFVATGLLGTVAYLRSGELAAPGAWRLAWWLSGASVAGALAGTVLNPLLPKRLFGVLLGLFAIAIGALIAVRQLRGGGAGGGAAPRGRGSFSISTPRGRVIAALLGVGIGLSGALLGVGGPVLAVPALVVLGVPMLAAVAVAQVQSVFIAAFATLGYAWQGAVSWPLAALVGLPLLAGAFAGWRIAQRTRPERLEVVLGVALVVVGVYLLT